MKKHQLMILTVLGYGWMAGLGWGETLAHAPLKETGAATTTSASTMDRTGAGLFSGEVKPASNSGAALPSNGAEQPSKPRTPPSARPAPPAPANLRIVVTRSNTE